MRVADRALTRAEAEAVASWRYPPPYDLYDAHDPEVFLLPDCFPLLDGEALAGFLQLGAEARINGQQEQEGVLDLGLGLHPGRVGRGAGTALWPEVRRFVVARCAPRALRTVVADFNERSTRLCLSAGFVVVRELPGPGGRPFRELLRTPA